MRRLPDAVFVIDLKAEMLAVREARRLKIPLIGLVDTNCDPDEVDLVIPGNDDAIRSCALLCRVMADGVREGRATIPTTSVADVERGRRDGRGRRAGEGEEGAAAAECRRRRRARAARGRRARAGRCRARPRPP